MYIYYQPTSDRLLNIHNNMTYFHFVTSGFYRPLYLTLFNCYPSPSPSPKNVLGVLQIASDIGTSKCKQNVPVHPNSMPKK